MLRVREVVFKMKKVYLDHAATTPVDPRVVEAMLPYFSEKYGNPSSLHEWGREAREAVESSRKLIAKKMGVKPEEIYFTSGGTESDNLAIKGTAFANKGNHLITTKIEHSAVLRTVQWMQTRGYKATFLGVDKFGLLAPERVRKAINGFGKKTFLVSVMYANNEIGTIEPIPEIASICKDKGVLFHTDAVQAFGKIPLDLKNVDLMSASSHKIYGPKGVGLIYVKEGTKIQSIQQGGNHERGLRSSTENVPGIVGFAKAVELVYNQMSEEIKRETRLRDKLIKQLLEIPDTSLNGHPQQRLPNNVNITFNYIEGEALLLLLDKKGIAASTGSACSSHSLKPSHVIMAINEERDLTDCGLTVEEKAHGSLRLTLGKSTTEEDINYTVEAIKEAVEKLRKISPLAKKKK